MIPNFEDPEAWREMLDAIIVMDAEPAPPPVFNAEIIRPVFGHSAAVDLPPDGAEILMFPGRA